MKILALAMPPILSKLLVELLSNARVVNSEREEKQPPHHSAVFTYN